MTELLFPQAPQDVQRAVELIKSGQLVALPTETVYGLFGLALENHVVKSIYDVKHRTYDHALNLNISNFDEMKFFSQKESLPFSMLFDILHLLFFRYQDHSFLSRVDC